MCRANIGASYEGLSGKRVLVTGASAGIGAAIAVALGQAGCRLALHYNTREEGVLETARRVVAAGGAVDAIVQADFRSSAAVEDVWKHVDAAWGGDIDCLVNNAGAVTKCAATEHKSFSAWDDTMNINLHAPYRLACGAHARMSNKGKEGQVVMVSSVHGTRSVEWMSAYAASKAALDSLTRTLGVEWAPDGVRVVGVAPGPVPVERTAARIQTPEAQALWRPHLPLGRMGTVDEIADAVLWLMQSPASAWITGQTVTLDGGLSARLNMPVRPRPPEAEDSAAEAVPPTARLLDAPQFYSSQHDEKMHNGHSDPQQPKTIFTVEEAREAATRASKEYGAASPEAANAWAIVDEMENRSERGTTVVTLEEECEIDATALKCRQLAKDLEELDSLIAAGPDASPLREAAKRMLREIEERHDSGPFSKKN